MGATLEQFDLTAEDYGGLQGKCHEALVLHRPDVIEGVHDSMVEAGAEVVETDTFQASRLKLDEWGLGRRTRSRSTARPPRSPARRSARSASSPARSARPATCPPPTTRRSGRIRFRELVEVFAEQAQGLVEGGADLLIIETAQDILEVKAAIFGAREAFKRVGPHACRSRPRSRCCRNGGKMLLGTDIARVLTTLEALKVDVIGLNCSTGPEDMRDAIRFLGEYSPRARSTASRTPACRSRAPTARRSSPRSPSRWPTCSASSSSATACRSSAAAAARRRPHRAIAERCAGRTVGPRPERRARRSCRAR